GKETFPTGRLSRPVDVAFDAEQRQAATTPVTLPPDPQAVAAAQSGSQLAQPQPADAPATTSPREAQFIAAQERRPSLAPLGLYGQLPQADRAVSSPLDSPDNVMQVTFATEGGDFDPAIDPTGTLLAYAS